MGLCSVCSAIPFEGLPRPLKGRFTYPSAASVERHAQSMGISNDSKPENDNDILKSPGHQLYILYNKSNTSLGHSHRSFQSLKKQSSSCPLCDRIFEAADQFRKNIRGDAVYNDLYGPDTSDFRIYITKRETKAAGFQMWANSRCKGTSFMLGSVGLCVSESSALASVFKGRPIEPNPNSSTSWKRVQYWIDYCDWNHKEVPLKGTQLPTRVIDIGTSNSNIRLLLTKKSDWGLYTTLSYRWPSTSQSKKKPKKPKVPNWQTSLSTLAAKQRGIAWNSLPQTYQDAVTLTRNLKVGVRYLWIDGLCNIQDDKNDLDEQMPKMAEIYANSYLTISASWSETLQDGPFADRKPPTYAKFQYTAKKSSTSGTVQAFLEDYELSGFVDQDMPLKHELLSTRGWTFQERFLSPRSIYYAESQLYFECCKEFRGETGLRIDGRLYGLHKKKLTNVYWNQMIELYSIRKLAFNSDKLKAVAGLALKFNEQLRDTYLAGHWKATLLRDLLWSIGASEGKAWSLKQPYVAPSWSWATIDGEIHASSFSYPKIPFEELANILDANVTHKTHGKVYLEVTAGYLKIRGPWIGISIVRKNSGSNYRCTTRSGSALKSAAQLDYKIAWNTVKTMPIYALVLGVVKKGKGFPLTRYPSILVTKSRRNSNQYRRIGMILLDAVSLGREAPGKYASWRTVELI